MNRTKVIYLISVDYIYQYLPLDADAHRVELIQGFTNYLEGVAISIKAELLAEEFSVEALEMSQATLSTAQKVAEKLNLNHQFCDPTTKERNENYIKNDDFSAREQYWLKQLLGKEETTVIFICGNDHIHNFSLLLQQSDFQVEVQFQQWGEEAVQQYQSSVAMGVELRPVLTMC